MITTRLPAMAVAVVAVLAVVAPAHPADLTVVSTNAFKTVLEELGPQFERASGHKLTMRFASTSDMKARIEKGEAFDVALLTTAAADDLIKQAKLNPATRTEVARSGVGVAIRKDAPKPDLSSADAFKRSLVKAKSITYSATGLTGSGLRKIFERFGIANEMQTKTRLASGNAAEAVARGEAELGFTQASEILHVAGADYAGPLPEEVQIYTVFAAAAASAGGDAAASSALVRFLSAPAAEPVIRAKGMEPAPGR